MKGKEIKKILLTVVVAGVISQNTGVQALENKGNEQLNESVITTEISEENQDAEEPIVEESEEIVKEQSKKEVEELKSEVIKKGWVLENKKYYFYNEDGTLKKGFYKDKYGDTYYLDLTTGEMNTGWVKIEEEYYSFKDNGVMRKGWYDDGHDWYFLNKETGVMHKGWYKDGKDWYFLNDKGAMKTGWYNDGENYYFLNSNGTMKTGFYTDRHGDTYYLNDKTGVMATGWDIGPNENYYYYKDNGVRVTGWILLDNLWYYLDKNFDGAMVKGIVEIGGKDYRFYDNGVLIVDRWYEGGTTYSDLNGEFKVINPEDAASGIQYNMVRYMSTLANRESVHNKSIALHNGILENNCVYFTSELLRRVGINIPNYIANTVQLERQLLNRGWKKHTNLNNLKPGDIVFAGYAHAYTFLGWAGDGYAYIVDNQKSTFGSVLHKRKVSIKDPEFDTNKSTHFFRA